MELVHTGHSSNSCTLLVGVSPALAAAEGADLGALSPLSARSVVMVLSESDTLGGLSSSRTGDFGIS